MEVVADGLRGTWRCCAVVDADEGWLSTQSAARYCRRHPNTIREAAASGDLHGSRRQHGRGSRWSFQRADLDAWLRGADQSADALEEHITRLVAKAPPLTSEQRDRLAGLFLTG